LSTFRRPTNTRIDNNCSENCIDKDIEEGQKTQKLFKEKKMQGNLQLALICVGAALSIGLAGLGAGIGIGSVGNGACQGLARNPEVQPKLMVFMILGMALAESVAIYGLVISLILLYANPLLG
jgi:F-type H+-transporting ATPase subunit c